MLSDARHDALFARVIDMRVLYLLIYMDGNSER